MERELVGKVYAVANDGDTVALFLVNVGEKFYPFLSFELALDVVGNWGTREELCLALHEKHTDLEKTWQRVVLLAEVWK